MVFVAGGVVASTEVLGWLDPTIGSESVRWVAEATLTVVLFSDASRIDLAALRREYVVPLRLLGIGLPLTIVAGALAGVVVFGQLALIEAVLLAIVLAPTDAALGQAVVTDPRIPSRVRQGLNVESGLNDGICVPLLLIAIAIAEAQEGAIGDGAAARLVLEEIGYGIAGGVPGGARSGDRGQAGSRAPPRRSGLAAGRPGRRGRARVRAGGVDGRQRVHRRLRRRRRLRLAAPRRSEAR